MARSKEHSTNRATEFSKDLVRFLNRHPRFNEKYGLSWERNWFSNEEKFGSVDVVGESRGKPRIFIEAELLRDHPASNMVKLWDWATKKAPGKILIVQAFSKAYRGKKRRVRALSEFIGKKMAKEIRGIRYIAVNMKYNPRPGGKKGAGRRRHHAHELGARVQRLCRLYL